MNLKTKKKDEREESWWRLAYVLTSVKLAVGECSYLIELRGILLLASYYIHMIELRSILLLASALKFFTDQIAATPRDYFLIV